MAAPFFETSWVCGGVHQARAGGLFPGEVIRLRHQLVGLDDGEVGEAAEVCLVAPDALLGIHHRVVVAIGAFELH